MARKAYINNLHTGAARFALPAYIKFEVDELGNRQFHAEGAPEDLIRLWTYGTMQLTAGLGIDPEELAATLRG